MTRRLSSVSAAAPVPAAEQPGSMKNRGAAPRFTAFLHAGQVFASSKPEVVLTILGSCVSVCLWEPELAVGGMNHFLLPHGPESGVAATRFGNGATLALIEKLEVLGCRKAKLRAKVFGGACVLNAQRGDGSDLGEKNARAAFAVLEAERIPVVSQDVGGDRGRKLVFSVAGGEAWVKRI
jgi:chemotaxis protein CheD